ncbi:hypothetical protein EJB05_05516 [Eragrostis curvula]|uniref:Uncharacterized protein n=1 Tax=Eragrostis curvula TaxID=38414 RepID=A0A5J9WDC1_9POAL|nr:hypothetical protein EJB05_05516 [Eragrostis curvula]
MQVPVDAADVEDPPPPSQRTVFSNLCSSSVLPSSHMDLSTFQSMQSITGVHQVFHGFRNFGLPNQLGATNFPGLPLSPFNQFGTATSTHAPTTPAIGNMYSFQDLLQTASSGLRTLQVFPEKVQNNPYWCI